MMTHLPLYLPLAFGFITLAVVWFFYRAVRLATTAQNANLLLLGLVAWWVVQMVISLRQVYSTNTHTLPPKILIFGVLPTILCIVWLFVSARGKLFIDKIPLVNLTYLHTVRVPVELVLWGLFMHKAIPELMTFEGRNFDIIAGITAPLVAYFGQKKPKMILFWNIASLGLLINIVVNALLSAPSPFQRFAFEQPNLAILYFPFSGLPTVVVPIVLFSHLVSIRQLSKTI